MGDYQFFRHFENQEAVREITTSKTSSLKRWYVTLSTTNPAEKECTDLLKC